MKIIDLQDFHKPAYFKCLEDWSDEMKEAGDRKSRWYEHYKNKGLRVKLAVEEDVPAGMIQYIPVENSHISGKNLYFIYCIWVHGYKQGAGNRQHRGLGKALLQAAEEDARNLGALGMAAWGVALPFWMKASWFKNQGYRTADSDGIARLMWKPFSDLAEKPSWIRTIKKPVTVEGKVVVTSFVHGWCPAQNLSFERAKRASAASGEHVIFKEIDTTQAEYFNEWGITDALFIDNKPVNTGPPPSYRKIEGLIRRQMKRKSLV